MASNEAISVAFIAETQQLQTGADQAASIVQDAVRKMEGGAAEAAGPMQVIEGSLKNVAGEAANAAGATEALATAQAGASMAAGGLAAALGSAGATLAMTAAGWALAKLNEKLFDNEAALKHAADEGERHAKVMRDLAFETDQYLAKLRGAGAAALWRGEQLKKVDEDEYKEKKKLRELQDEIDNAERLGATGRVPDLTREKEKELQRLAGYEQNWIRERARIQSEYLARSDAEEAKAGEKAAKERERQQQRDDDAAQRRAEQERKRHDREVEQATAYLSKTERAFQDGERKKIDDAAKAEDEMMKDLEKASEREAKIMQGQYAKQQKALFDFNTWAERQDEIAAKKREHVWQQYTSAIVSSFTHGLAQMAKGQASFADMSKAIWSGLVDVALRAIEQWVTAQIMAAITGKTVDQVRATAEVSHNAAVAGSGAASSQASIPYVGPALAAAALAETTALVLSTSMPLASARSGFYDIPNDQLVFTHTREQVLPAEYAEGLRQLIASGGGRGGPSFTIVTPSPKAFRDTLADGSSELNRELRRWDRRRRR